MVLGSGFIVWRVQCGKKSSSGFAVLQVWVRRMALQMDLGRVYRVMIVFKLAVIAMNIFSIAAVLLGFGVVAGFAEPCFAQAQTEGLTRDTSPPPLDKLYENDLRLPDDTAKLFLPDEAYLRWPLPPGEEAYAGVDGLAMKKQIPEITAISRKSRDDGNQSGAGSRAHRMTG